MSDKFYLVLGIILFILGVGAIGASISNKISCTQTVTATVSSVKVKRHNIRLHLMLTYTPTFTYTVDGKKYSTPSNFSSVRSKKYEKGKEYEIKVNPKDPKEICHGSNLSLILFGIVCAGAGITMAVAYFL